MNTGRRAPQRGGRSALYAYIQASPRCRFRRPEKALRRNVFFGGEREQPNALDASLRLTTNGPSRDGPFCVSMAWLGKKWQR